MPHVDHEVGPELVFADLPDLSARGLTVGYGTRPVLADLDLTIPAHRFTAIVGPNACGKSTLLRSLIRLLPAREGSVWLGEQNTADLRGKQLARRIAFLPQESVVPEGISVRRLVARGRFPHQTMLSTWSPQDEAAVSRAMTDAGVDDLADREVAALSGGQRQRVWIAMTLAQETPYLLLDEPTTYLDVTHQYELLRLLRRMVARGRTVVTVLHDINQACRFADHLIAMRDGAVVCEGAPTDVVDAELMRQVFDLDALVVADPATATPMVVPLEPGDER